MPVNTKAKTQRKSQTKKQTQLTFDPVRAVASSSSSALPAARVRYLVPGLGRTRSAQTRYTEESSRLDIPNSQYPAVISSPPNREIDTKLPFKPLPTPVKSSQTKNISITPIAEINSSDDNDTDVKPYAPSHHSPLRASLSGRTKRTVKHHSPSLFIRPEVPGRGTAMSPSAQASDSDGSPGEDEAVPSHRKRNTNYPSHNRPQNNAHNSTAIDLYESSDGSTAQSEHRTPSKNFAPSIFNTRLSGSKVPTSASPSNSSKRSKLMKQHKSSNSIKVRGMSTEISSIQLSPRKSQHHLQWSIPSEDESQPAVPASAQRRRRDTVVLDDSDSDAINLSTSPKSKSAQGRFNATAPIQVDDESATINSISSKHRPVSLPSEDEDEDDQPIISPLKRRRNPVQYSSQMSPAKRSRRHISVTDDENDSDLPPPTSIIKSLREDKGKGRAEEDTPTRLTRQRATSRRHRTEKEKKLELLRRRRAGEKINQLTDSDSSEEEKAALYDSGEGNEFLSNFPDESEDEKIENAPESSHRKSSNHRHNENDDEEDDDNEFIVDDDDEMLGVPTVGLQDIPLEFTYAAHKPLKEHFRDAIEWMVHLKINPGFNRDDPIYINAFKKLDDEVSGYARSKFLSAAWNEDFSKAIKSRPLIEVGELPSADHLRKCSACNRSGHPSTYVITLSGHPYHKETLEEVEQDDSEEDGSHTSVNSQGQDLPPDGKEWYVGSTCAMNAEWAHRLSHWKYELNDWVVDNLTIEGYLTGEELAKKEKLKSKQKREYTNAIVDKWENEGTIKSLYTDFKRNMEAARASKMQKYSRR